MKALTLKILTHIATVLAALLLYGVIVILQMPKARAADDVQSLRAGTTAIQVCQHDHGGDWR